VLDESGAVLMRQKLTTTPKAMREAYGAMPRGPDRAENWDALAVGEKVPERVGESASGSERDPGASKDSAGEHGTGTGQELRGADYNERIEQLAQQTICCRWRC
jgi:hypothetical protein